MPIHVYSSKQQIADSSDIGEALPEIKRSSLTKTMIIVFVLAILLSQNPDDVESNQLKSLNAGPTQNSSITEANRLSAAQIAGKVVTITRLDGKIFSGKLLSQTTEQIELEADEIKLILPRKNVAQIVFQNDIQAMQLANSF